MAPTQPGSESTGCCLELLLISSRIGSTSGLWTVQDRGVLSVRGSVHITFHIIKVTDRKEAGTISFEEAKEKILEKLKAEKQQDMIMEFIESLKAKANIVYPSSQAPTEKPETNQAIKDK